MPLFGLDCSSCKHDNTKGYRLRFGRHRNTVCRECHREGTRLPDTESLTGVPLVNRRACTPCGTEWRADWQPERNDFVFKANQLDNALAQMNMLGVENPGLGYHIVLKHPSIPVGFDARRLLLTEEPLPKISVYFRWEPMAGELLTPNNMFQKIFPPDASAAERRTAPERILSEEECRSLIDRRGGTVHTEFSLLKCQHCMQPIPLRTLTTLTLREVDCGD